MSKVMADLKIAADRLGHLKTKSTKHMGTDERSAACEQMLLDLDMLARRDGCIAAAWALEWIVEATERLSVGGG
jgi:hypothetical protein